jgi:hypothetical protein
MASDPHLSLLLKRALEQVSSALRLARKSVTHRKVGGAHFFEYGASSNRYQNLALGQKWVAHIFLRAPGKKNLTSFSTNGFFRQLELFKSVCLVPRRMRKIRLVIPTGQNSRYSYLTRSQVSVLCTYYIEALRN